AQDNAVYDINPQLIFYDDPMFGPYEGWYRQIAAKPRYTDPRADLRYFSDRYARIEAERRPLSWWLGQHPELASERDFPAFYTRFYEAVAHRRAVAEAAEAAVGRVTQVRN
ncbi:MAG TPA: hypothetical protein VFG12_05415, partial [Rhodopila sp.]|nr:hypothetical protein [Rhodopila sp.]